jgi:transglutaminase-like putative cysteine protease
MPLRSFTPAELSLTERKRLEQPLLVMVWLGVVMFALAEGQLFYLAAGTIVVGVNLVAVRQGKEVSLQRLFVNLAVLGATGVLALELVARDLPPLLALGHYLILIQLCKLFEQKRNRDYAQMIALSLPTVVAAGIVTQGLWFAALLVVYLVLAARVTMIFTLKRGLDAAASARLPVEAGPLPPDRVAWNVIRDWPRSALRRRLVLVLAIMAATTATTFFLVPRTRAGPGPFSGQAGMVGRDLDQGVRLGDVDRVYLSDKVVMHVQADGPGTDVPPLYLRGAAYQHYEDSRWTQGGEARWGAPFESAGPRPQNDPRGRVVQRISMRPGLLPVIYAVYPAVRVETEAGHVRHNGLLSAQIVANERGEGPARYTATSWPRPLNRRQRQYLASLRRVSGRRFATALPEVEVSPRVRELARQWCADLLGEGQDVSDLAIAGRIARRLRRDYGYTLDLSGAEPDRDGVEDFLFHTRRGHCEYFASAMAVMCNALDVRARLAVGYLADERDDLTGQYVVRERDAHAWVEVFTPETDWVTFDPTPAAPPGEPPSGLWQRVKGLWGALQFAWYDRVVGFDAELQKAMGRWLWNQAADAGDVIGAAFAHLEQSIYGLLAHGYVDRVVVALAALLVMAATAIVLLLALRLLRFRARRQRRRGDPQLEAHRRLRCIRELLDDLERRGLPRRSDWTLRRRALEAAERFHLSADVLGDLVALHYRLRWGGEVPTEDDLRAAEDSVRNLRRRLAA